MQDLEDLSATDPKVAARLHQLLEAVQADRNLLDLLTVHDFGADQREIFHVSRWQEYWRDDKDLWRLKLWELEHQGHPYRIIYALKRGTGNYFVLGILHRDFNYDPNHPATQRILRAYGDL